MTENGRGAVQLRREKAALRAQIRRRASAMDPAEIVRSGRAVAESVLASSLWRKAGSVFLYINVGWEPDTRILLIRALAEGKHVFVPKCLPGPERVMLAVRIRAAEELVPGAFGIPEPRQIPGCPAETAQAREFDLMLIPCVTADREGNRLGRGAGYYDRFLAPLGRDSRSSNHAQSNAFPAAVCLCHAALLTDRVPAGPFDIRMDFVAAGDPLP